MLWPFFQNIKDWIFNNIFRLWPYFVWHIMIYPYNLSLLWPHLGYISICHYDKPHCFLWLWPHILKPLQGLICCNILTIGFTHSYWCSIASRLLFICSDPSKNITRRPNTLPAPFSSKNHLTLNIEHWTFLYALTPLSPLRICINCNFFHIFLKIFPNLVNFFIFKRFI